MSIPKRERPRIYDPAKPYDWRYIQDVLNGLTRRELTVIDTYRDQLAELFIIQRPSLIHREKQGQQEAVHALLALTEEDGPLEQQGKWVLIPWLGKFVHILDEDDFHRVRTSRNPDLITVEEQKRFYQATVGVAGLSVGSNVALMIALQGGARHIRLADFDTLELSNTNRLIAGVDKLGLPKTTIIARQIWELNPYAQIDIFDEGLTEKNVASFVNGLDIVIDEMDDFVIKQRLRELARKHRIPLLSAADNGDRSTVDVERHDHKKRTPYFLGRLGKTSVARFKRLKGDKPATIRTIGRLIGAEHHPIRMIRSLPKIGETLVSVPQLGSTALMGAAIVSKCVRMILTGEKLPSGRKHICLDEHLDPDYRSEASREERKALTEMLARKLGL